MFGRESVCRAESRRGLTMLARMVRPARRSRHARLVSCTFFLGLSGAAAQGGTWVGPPGGNWNKPAHWSGCVDPPQGGTAVELVDVEGSRGCVDLVDDAFCDAPVNSAGGVGGSLASLGKARVT